MISVNLLPDEYRKRARSPIGMILAIAAAALLNTSLIAYWGYLEYGVSANIETTRSVLQLDLGGLEPQVNYHNKLQKEIRTRSAREQTLAEITKNRVLWTKALDDLLDIVHAGREGIEHFVWFDNVDVKMSAGDARRGNFGQLKAAGHSGSDEYDQVANFLDDMEDPELSALWQIFGKPAAPEASVNDADDDLIPAVNWSFPLTLKLVSPDDRVRNRGAAVEDDK